MPDLLSLVSLPSFAISRRQPLPAPGPCAAMSKTDRAAARVEVTGASVLARWAATFRADLHSAKVPFHQGEIVLSQSSRLALLDDEQVVVDARFLRENESISVGDQVSFPCYIAMAGGHVDLRSSMASDKALQPPTTKIVREKVLDQSSEPTLNVNLDLDLRSGMEFQRFIWQKFNSPVAFAPGRGARELFLVASFKRHKHRLDCSNVSEYLRSCLGGIAFDFRVCYLRDRSFRFFVFSKKVGFAVNGLKSYECSQFMVYFSLWGNGGPDFIREFRLWEAEELRSWTVVGKKKTLAVDNMTQHRQGFGHKGLTGANGIPLGLHIKDSALHREAEQHRVNLPLSASVKRPSFIHKLSSSEKEDLYKLFVDGFDFFSIQEFFRLTYPRSILDYLSKEEEAELKILLAANISSEAIGELFAPDKSSTHEKGSAVPVSSVFDRIQQDLAAKSVTVDKVNMPTGRVSVFDRLDRPVL